MTVANIVNQALVGIGAQKITSLEDGSNNADTAALFYDDARREVIKSANWGFARKTEDLEACKVLLVTSTPADGIPVNGVDQWVVQEEPH